MPHPGSGMGHPLGPHGRVGPDRRHAARDRPGSEVAGRLRLFCLCLDELHHLLPGQLGGHGPVVDDQAERGDDHYVPPERDVEGVGRRQRLRHGGQGELALPGDDAQAEQPHGQPHRRLPVQRRPVLVERHRDADQHVPDHQHDAELPDHLEARPVDEQVGDDERGRGEHRGGRHAVRPVRIRHLPAEGAQGQWRARVHQYARAGDHAYQRAPARERQQEEQPEQEREDQPDPRNAGGVGPAEELRGVPVSGQAVADPRGSGRVDEAGAGRGDERVDPQDRRQPGDPGQGRDSGERPGDDLGVGDVREPVRYLRPRASRR